MIGGPSSPLDGGLRGSDLHVSRRRARSACVAAPLSSNQRSTARLDRVYPRYSERLVHLLMCDKRAFVHFSVGEAMSEGELTEAREEASVDRSDITTCTSRVRRLRPCSRLRIVSASEATLAASGVSPSESLLHPGGALAGFHAQATQPLAEPFAQVSKRRRAWPSRRHGRTRVPKPALCNSGGDTWPIVRWTLGDSAFEIMYELSLPL